MHDLIGILKVQEMRLVRINSPGCPGTCTPRIRIPWCFLITVKFPLGPNLDLETALTLPYQLNHFTLDNSLNLTEVQILHL